MDKTIASRRSTRCDKRRLIFSQRKEYGEGIFIESYKCTRNQKEFEMNYSEEFHFPETFINTVDANGFSKTPLKKGVTICLWSRNGIPVRAEVGADNDDDGDEYAVIGLTVENGELVGYDGVYFIPTDVLDILENKGVEVNEIRSTQQWAAGV